MTRVMTRNYTRNPPFHVRKKFQKWMKICSHLSSIFAPWKLRRRFSSGPAVKCGNSSRTNGNVFRFLHNLGRIYTHTHTHKYRQISFFFLFPSANIFAVVFYRQIETENKGEFITSLESEINISGRELLSGWWVGLSLDIAVWHITVTQVTQTHIGEYRFNKRRVKIYIKKKR